MSEPFVEVIDVDALQQRVAELGREITDSLTEEDPVVIGVLKGSVPFLTDLSKHLPLTVEMDFLNLTRFGREGRVSVAMDLSVPIEGRSVLIVEDIVDTGLTLSTLRKMLTARGASSVTTVALLDKATRRIVDVPVEHRGFEVGDEFLLGYGMDWQGRYRNVPSIWAVMDLSVLTSDPDAFGRRAFAQLQQPSG
ncbi:MAG: hypoxanthine phosphoribosyltransferase [Acidimicrobiia bacterium]